MMKIETLPILGALLMMHFLAACSSAPVLMHQNPDGQSTLYGWRNCLTENCGRNFISAYSTFVFIHIDEKPISASPSIAISPGRHWIEAFYSWGAGVLIGTGNYRHYGFELDVLPGHQYRINEVPAGCIVPATKYWVSQKNLRLAGC